MSSPPKFVLTSSLYQPSRLGDTLVTGNNTGIRQGEEVEAHELTIELQKRAKQICDADKERFKQFYDDELRRKRPKQSRSREGEGVQSNNAAQRKLRARQEQRLRDDQLLEGRRLARQRASQEQRVKDAQLLERHRLEKLRNSAGGHAVQLLNTLQQKARERSFTDGHIAADGVLPSFLDKEYQYK